MKRKPLPLLAAALAVALTASSPATVLVDLDATALAAGTPLPTWSNAGAHPGNFNSAGTAVPNIATVLGVNCVPLTATSFFAGPGAPASVGTNTASRSIEVWTHNAALVAEETLVAWGRRGGPNGCNWSFNFGNNATFGALGGWGAWDVGWGTTVPAAAQWHHLVITFDGTTVRVYADGVQSNSKVTGGFFLHSVKADGVTPLPIVIGGQNNNVSPFNPLNFNSGLEIAKVKIHDTVLTAAEVFASYAADAVTFGKSTALLPKVLTFSAGTTFMAGQPVTFTYETNLADSVSVSDGVNPVFTASGAAAAGGTFIVYPAATTTYTLTATNGNGSAPGAAVTLSPASAPLGLVHRWSFNESNAGGAADTNCLDSVGVNHGASSGVQNATIRGTYNATVGTASAWTRATAAGTAAGTAGIRLGGGASASSAYIDLPNSVMSGLTQVTFEGWMTFNGAQSWSRIFDLGTNSNGEQAGVGGSGNGTEYMLVSLQNGGTATTRRVSLRDNNVENLIDVTGEPAPSATQFHFAAVYDPTGNGGVSPAFKFYRDGVLRGTLNSAFRPQDMVFVNNWLGRSNWGGDANTNGTYNEFRIWGAPMTTDMIAASIAAGPDGTPPSLPLLTAFAAFPAVAQPGQPVRLSWQASNGTGPPTTLSMDQGVTLPNPGSLFDYVTVTPAATTTYTLTATDGTTPTSRAVTVVVASRGPTALAGSTTTSHMSAIATPLAATDMDTAPAALTYTIVTPPVGGVLSGTAPALTYTPNGGYAGTDTFTWKASDSYEESNVATFSVTVHPAAVAPTAVMLSEASHRTDYVAGSFAGRLQAADGNPDDFFSYQLVSGAGDTHNAYFTIFGNQLLANHDFSGDAGQTISIRVRVTDGAGGSHEQIISRTVTNADLHVKINEIYYNSPRNTVPCEFIELYNPFATDQSVGNWRLTSGATYTIPDGTMIPANGYLVIAQNPANLAALYGISALGPWTGGLSSDGDTIELRDAANNQVDEVDYGINTPWPVPPNGDGPSLELINPALDNDLGGHWRSSTTAANPSDYISASAIGWRFRAGTSEASAPVNAWRAFSFTEDATWFTGRTPVGLVKINTNTAVAVHPESGVTLNTQLTATGVPGIGSDMATYVGAATGVLTNWTVNYRSVFFRKTFTVGATVPKALFLRVMHNDGAIVWINGVEVARFGFDPSKQTGDIAFNEAALYERGNDPWSDKAILNADSFLVPGTDNVLTIQGFAKIPVLRAGLEGQDVVADYNIFDFAVDAVLRPLNENFGTPGAQNSVFAANAPPAIRQVDHSPQQPKSNQSILVTARISDRQGIASAQLSYQINAPGAYLSATQTLGVDAVGLSIINNSNVENQPNPAFEDPANWTSLAMTDNGSVQGDTAGDGVFSARIPAQPHRTLVRYRVTATDLSAASVRVPLADDPSKNFACFVYNGVPAYETPSASFSAASLQTLPVYQWIMRPEDFEGLNAYTPAAQPVANGGANVNNYDLNLLLNRRFYNFEGAMVYDGKVYDHTQVRLRGGNSRYNGAGKRHYRFKFPKGYAFEAKDRQGRRYPRDWEDMLFNKLFGNKGAYDWGLPYHVGAKLWENMGVPMPYNHWVHFRVVRGAQEAPTFSTGDFHGLFQALELPEGKNFLKARNLPEGNFYKMSDFVQNGEMNERYQAAGSVDYAEDYDNIRYNAHPQASQAWLETNIDMANWYNYRVIQEAVRHYDIFVDPTGRHRMKNLYWYFRPSANPNGLGQLVQMPYDWDASFGPNWNHGNEYLSNALHISNNNGTNTHTYTAAPTGIIDSPTWINGGALPNRMPLRTQFRNRVRESLDLMIHRDGTGRGPVDDIIDDAVAQIAAFYPADMARWPGTTGAGGHWAGGAPAKAQDMKNFMFSGWTDSFGGDPAVPAGGRAGYLLNISDNMAYNATTLDGDVGRLPAKPTLTYSGVGGYPLDGLAFTSSAFSDPQGAGEFGAYQFRIGEITDVTAPAYDPADDRIYEIVDVWRSAEITDSAALSLQIPAAVVRQGHTYRARVRHKDSTGRYSRWSDPIQFTTGEGTYDTVLSENLYIAEVMYKPAPPTAIQAGTPNFWTENDFEYIELTNRSTALTLDLTNVRFTKGIDYDFALNTMLAPGATKVLVRRLAAFQSRYPAVPAAAILGEWDVAGTNGAGDNLSNGGEQLKLSYGAGNAIHDLTYADVLPWPADADNGGVSMVYAGPNAVTGNPDPQAVGSNWIASCVTGGSPGAEEFYTFPRWMTARGLSDPADDANQDGWDNLADWAFARDLSGANPSGGIVTDGADRYLQLTYARRCHAQGVTWHHEIASDLTGWSSANAFILSATANGDGTETITFRCILPVDAPSSGTRWFIRARAEVP